MPQEFVTAIVNAGKPTPEIFLYSYLKPVLNAIAANVEIVATILCNFGEILL
jgi:hypothetical protein